MLERGYFINTALIKMPKILFTTDYSQNFSGIIHTCLAIVQRSFLKNITLVTSYSYYM